MSRLLITDTSCLIALERVDLLEILPLLFDDIVAPSAVVTEFGHRPEWLREEQVTDRKEVDSLLARRLDVGEAEAIVLASATPDTLLLIDEARGRKVAVSLGLPIIGTADLLALAKQSGHLSAVKPVLDALIHERDFRLAERHYEQVLNVAGEH